MRLTLKRNVCHFPYSMVALNQSSERAFTCFGPLKDKQDYNEIAFNFTPKQLSSPEYKYAVSDSLDGWYGPGMMTGCICIYIFFFNLRNKA